MSGIIAQNSGRHTGLVKASSGGGGVWNLIKTYTASGDSDLSFVDGTDGVDFTAYDEFVFKFISIHPSASSYLGYNTSTDGGSNYNNTKTTTFFIAYNGESAGPNLHQDGADNRDLAQETGDVHLISSVGTDNDQVCSGHLCLYNPNSTTFVKHFIATVNTYSGDDYSQEIFSAGYSNTTSAVDAVRFQMSSGNIDAGTISMYGIS
jgi:hypothetical protein